MFMPWCLLSLFLVAQLSLLGSAQTCYWPDKSVGETLISCNSAATSSHCCGVNSLCLDNGYCFNQGNEYGNRISRGGCTDRTWDSDACPKYCRTIIPDGGISISIVSETGNGLFCCGMGWNATSGLCLSESENGNFSPFTVGIGVAILDRTTGATTLNATTPRSTASNTSTATAQPDHNDHATNNIPMAIGIGVAVSVGVLLISASIFFLWRHRKRRVHQTFQQFDLKNSTPTTSYGPPSPYNPPTPLDRPTSQEQSVHIELEHSPRHPQGLGIQELDGNHWHHGHNVSQYKGV